LYRNDVVDYKNYLSLNQFNSIILSKKMIFSDISSLLDNKLSFSLRCDKYSLPVPKLIGYNLKNQFFFKETIILITKKPDLIDFFRKVFVAYKKDVLFLKPISGSGGAGCFLLEKYHIVEQIERYGDLLIKKSYLYQELIKQHPDIDTIHSKSINTLRLDTFIDTYHTPQVLSVLMRFGRGSSITDNTHTGGFYISVNSNTGKLQGVGRQDIIEGGRVFLNHPDTNFKLNGFKVPYFKEACDLAKHLTTYFPNRITGWDIAITEHGPVIIEGNTKPSLHVTDVAYGGYCSHPLIKDILKEIES
jgi:hypothetical protein